MIAKETIRHIIQIQNPTICVKEINLHSRVMQQLVFRTTRMILKFNTAIFLGHVNVTKSEFDQSLPNFFDEVKPLY